MPDCYRCGSFVTTDFIRVFGTNDGEVHRCPECASFKELIEGQAAGVG